MKAPKKGGGRFGTVPGDAELAGAYQTDILSSDGLRQQITVHFESLPLGGSGKTTPPAVKLQPLLPNGVEASNHAVVNDGSNRWGLGSEDITET